MINVLFGIQNELIENYIDDFAKKNKINNVIKYDYNDTNIETVIEEVSYLDLFGDKKLIVLYNSKFLTSEETLDNKYFEDYINSQNQSNYLFLITYSENLDERKKIVKLLRKKSEVREFNKFSEYDAYKYISELFERDDYVIEEKAVKEIVNRLSSNIGMIKNEVNKLKLYKLEDKSITIDDVFNITSTLPEDNLFKIVDALINNNKEEIFKLYDDFKLIGVDEIALIALIASNFRFMYQVKVLLNDNKTKNEIVSILKSHPYKTEITIKKVSSYNEEKLLDILYNLSLIDISIKTGEVDKGYALENFFLNL
jgi:DNA polymerase-3 subunit delta